MALESESRVARASDNRRTDDGPLTAGGGDGVPQPEAAASAILRERYVSQQGRDVINTSL
ncbi:hypothetical protein IscW_ISCW003509 [Ixodes scapularis]|uniref:Uncharacterized protein n=1 Tax=Ixodes scapularis TaxID=6945 RepID=B7PII5_IXOSC|nr:hypothetical protein IscW_ISCW003509 [Ixodes scapularis]|eukprot:XP_002405309.1 hypothetical protein IscW_ISCW003509 [Ixodes scapularis]